jgi:hypothetical protein
MITENVIGAMVDKLVAQFDPLKVVLFGSCATRRLKDCADVDLLVVMPDGVEPRRAAIEMLRALRGSGAAKDVIVATPSRLKRFGDSPGMLYRSALSEGKTLYERPVH